MYKYNTGHKLSILNSNELLKEHCYSFTSHLIP